MIVTVLALEASGVNSACCEMGHLQLFMYLK